MTVMAPSPKRIKHGHASADKRQQSGTYSSWQAMKQRCLNPNSTSYAYYGGRGITVSPRWVDSFENFLADMGERPAGASIDRIDGNGNYEPDNCRWANATEQRANQKTYTLTAEGRERIAASKRGKRRSAETRAKIAEAMANRVVAGRKCEDGCTCNRHSAETRAKASVVCQPGCTCKRHGCAPDCTCGRHSAATKAKLAAAVKRCEPGCTCRKHSAEVRAAVSAARRSAGKT
jgi:hypothetical protein